MKRILFVLLVVFTLMLGSCNSPGSDSAAFIATSAPLTTPTPTERPPASDTVRLVYQYGPLPNWIEFEHLRLTEDVPITFNSSRGWTLIEFVLIPYEGVELFSFKPDPPNYEDKLIGGCYWMDHGSEYEGRSGWDDTDWVWRTPNYDCPGLQPGTELTDIKMPMAYCTSYASATLCKKQGFTVVIEEGGTISFSAENTFLPEYRMWLEQVLGYFGGYPSLPAVLQPNYNYAISK